MIRLWRITQIEEEVVYGNDEFQEGSDLQVSSIGVDSDQWLWKAIPKKNFFGVLSEGRFLLRAKFNRGDGPIARKVFCGGGEYCWDHAEAGALVLPSPLSKELEQVNNLLDSFEGKPGGGNNFWLRMNMRMLEDRLVYYFDEFVRLEGNFCRNLHNDVTIIDVKPASGLRYDDEVNKTLEESTPTPTTESSTAVCCFVSSASSLDELAMEDRAVSYFDEFYRMVETEETPPHGKNVDINDVKPSIGLHNDYYVNDTLETSSPFHTGENYQGTQKDYQEMEVDGVVQRDEEKETERENNEGNNEGSQKLDHQNIPWVYQRYNFRSYPRLMDSDNNNFET